MRTCRASILFDRGVRLHIEKYAGGNEGGRETTSDMLLKSARYRLFARDNFN